MWNKIKTWSREYLTYQALNGTVDDIYSKLNSLNDSKVARTDCVSEKTPNKVVKRDSAGGISVGKITADEILCGGVLAANGVPIGTIIPYYGKTAPEAWLECNGETIGDAQSGATARANADTFDLFSLLWESSTVLLIQELNGAESIRGISAEADFKAHKRLELPDLRGVVIRGWDNGRGFDGEYEDDIFTGREFGSYQEDALKTHTHSLQGVLGEQGSGRHARMSGRFSEKHATGEAGESYENRVKNVATMFVIRAYNKKPFEVFDMDSHVIPIPTADPNCFIGWNADGTELVNVDSVALLNEAKDAADAVLAELSQYGGLDATVIGKLDELTDIEEYVESFVSGGGIKVAVSTPTSTVVTATDGTNTVTGTAVDDEVLLNIPNYGIWTFTGLYDERESDPLVLEIDTTKIYHASMTFFEATLVVTAESGATVTVTGEGTTLSQVSNGTATFAIYEEGTYSVTGVKGSDLFNVVSVTVTTNGETYEAEITKYKIFGVSIDLANSDPAAVTYTDDAVGMTGGSADWDSQAIFKDIKPCVFKDGVVHYYLNPNDFTQKANGTAADITTGDDGDVMIEIPKIGYKINTVENTLTVQITNDPNLGDEGFKYYAHTRTVEGDRDKLYIGAYLGYSDGTKLRSISGVRPTYAKTIGEFRSLSQANGTGYGMISFYPLTLLQCLYLIRYKNRDSQAALGKGATSNKSVATTGSTDTSGMCFGDATSDIVHVKFMGIEDFYGNLEPYIDGLITDADLNALTAFDNFNDTGEGYTLRGTVSHYYSTTGLWVTRVEGTSELGFIPKTIGGSSTTYFADTAGVTASCVAYFGGYFSAGVYAGTFRLCVDVSSAAEYGNNGCRLMYL